MNTSGPFPYCDGETVRSRMVEIDWQPDGGIRIVESTQSRSVPPGDFTISDPLGSIPCFLRIKTGGVVELPSDSVPCATAPGARHGIARAVHWLESRSLAAAAATALVVAAVGVGLWQGLPRLASHIAHGVPPAIEQKAGETAYRVFASSFPPTKLDFLAQARVQGQLDRLVQTQAPHVPPRLGFLTMGAPNAFALPGGIIVVADELIVLTANENEIAAVLAHELAHIERRHGLQSVLRNSAALIVVATLTGDLSTLSTFSATLPFLLLQYGYAREFEAEADRYAVELMAKAGIDAENLASILNKLEQARPGVGHDFSYLSTHPSTAARIQALRSVKPGNSKTGMPEPTAIDAGSAAGQALPSGAATGEDSPVSRDPAIEILPRCTFSRPPRYPDELRANNITGEAVVEFIVTTEGEVAAPFVVRATHPLFGEAALEAVRDWKFQPGVVAGRRVNARMQQPIAFSLNEEAPADE